MENNYADLTKLADGTKFRVDNGQWTGYVFSKNGKKYFHVNWTNKDYEVTGNEKLILEMTY